MAASSHSLSFGYCYTGGGWNCVVDGDTFWMEGVKIRVADIDAPETHPPHCPYEADLGDRATVRLHNLLNLGPVVLESLPDRDEDPLPPKITDCDAGRTLAWRSTCEGRPCPHLDRPSPPMVLTFDAIRRQLAMALQHRTID